MSLTPTMSWSPNTESDLAGYRIYYGDNPSLNPALGFFEVTVPCRPFLRLTGLPKYQTIYAKVTAFDSSNNEGGFAAVVSTFVTGGLIMK